MLILRCCAKSKSSSQSSYNRLWLKFALKRVATSILGGPADTYALFCGAYDILGAEVISLYEDTDF
jgi:hypothetical protein